MADYYSNYYAVIPYYSDEQKQWLIREMENPTEIEAARSTEQRIYTGDPEESWDFPFWEDTDTTLHLIGEHGSYHVAFLVLVYAERFHLFYDEPWVLETSYACSSSRSDGQGGSGYCIYQGQVFFVSTSEEIEKWLESHKQIEHIIGAWEDALNN